VPRDQQPDSMTEVRLFREIGAGADRSEHLITVIVVSFGILIVAVTAVLMGTG
jgi:hypothetical protein